MLYGFSWKLLYNAGTWSLTPSDASGVGLLNYTITYASVSTGLTVKPYVLSLNYLDTNGNPIAVTAQDKVYNGTTSDIIDDSTGNPITPVLSTLRFLTDKVTLVQGSVDFADPNVGTNKPVTFKGFSITGADVADYTLNPPPSNQTANITPATLVITAGSQIQPYGFGGKDAGTNASLGTTDFTAQVQIPDPTDPTDPTKDTYIPMYGSDSVTSVTLSTNASDSTSLNYNVALPDAAPWTITPSSPIGSGLSNYLIDPTTGYIPGTLTIIPKDLTITADNKSRSYGDVNPALTYAISGFVPGDFLDSSMVKGSPTITTTAGAQSGAGVYAITITNYGSLNYTNPNDVNYTFVNSIQQLVGGELTVQTVPLTVSLSPTQVYGQVSLMPTMTGFVNGDTETSVYLGNNPILMGSPSVSTVATPTSPVGSYPFTVKIGSLWSSDYAFTLVSGTLTVTPALLTVTSVTATRSYGTTTATTQSFNISGYVPNTISDVTGTPGVTTTTTATSSVRDLSRHAGPGDARIHQLHLRLRRDRDAAHHAGAAYRCGRQHQSLLRSRQSCSDLYDQRVRQRRDCGHRRCDRFAAFVNKSPRQQPCRNLSDYRPAGHAGGDQLHVSDESRHVDSQYGQADRDGR